MAGRQNTDSNSDADTEVKTDHLSVSELRALAQTHLQIIEAEVDAETQAQSQTEVELQKYMKTKRKSGGRQQPQRRSESPNQHAAALITSVSQARQMSGRDDPSQPTANTDTGNDGTNLVKSKLRPAADILDRLKWDPSLNIKDYHIGYLERFEGIKEMPASQWIRESTEEEFIPQHRIKWIKKRTMTNEQEEDVVVWDRERRVDKIFGSGLLSQSDEAVNGMGAGGRGDLESTLVDESVDGGVAFESA